MNTVAVSAESLATTALYVETTLGLLLLLSACFMIGYSLWKNSDSSLIKIGIIAGVISIYMLVHAG